MKIIKGNKEIELAKDEFLVKISTFKSVWLDLGCGDGRFVYKNAKENLRDFYLGVDPSKKQLEIYSKKINKDRLENVLLVLASAESLPSEATGVCDTVSVLFPWGSLLSHISLVNSEVIKSVKSLLKMNGKLVIVFGYSEDFDSGEFKRLNLPKINEDYLNNVLIPKFRELGFTLENQKLLNREDIKNFETSWSKKLTFGQDRPVFYLELRKC